MHNKFSLPIGVHLVILKGSQILLIQRRNTGYADGIWSLPAGAIDGKETLKSAMIREAHEELGISISSTDLHFDGIMHKIESDNYENLAAFFICNNWKGDIDNKEPDKCLELQFFPLKSILKNCSPYITKYLLNLHNKEYLEFKN